jgi:uncharacterized protein (TIGR00251 family)
MSLRFTETPDGAEFTVRVIPRAKKTETVGELDGALKVRISAPPVDGAANDELIRFLSKLLKVPRSAVEIVSGSASRTKRIRIVGIAADSVQDAIDR